jgi:hypothetical protein
MIESQQFVEHCDMPLMIDGNMNQVDAGSQRRPLAFRRIHDESVQLLRDADLATQPGTRADFARELQHVVFHFARGADLRSPFLIDQDMAGGAGQATTALCLDARQTVANGPLHHRETFFDLDGARDTVVTDVGDLRHAASSGRCFADWYRRIRQLFANNGQTSCDQRLAEHEIAQ